MRSHTGQQGFQACVSHTLSGFRGRGTDEAAAPPMCVGGAMAALPNCLSPHPEGPFTLFNPYLTHTVLGLKLFTALILSGPGEAAGAQVLGQPGLPRARGLLPQRLLRAGVRLSP